MKLEDRISLKFSGIYLIKNKITGHCYVGQAKDISKRIWSHLNSTINESKQDYNTPLHKAFRKYGFDNFDLQVLEICNHEKLNDREQYWVIKLNTKKNGYNQTNGGEHSVRFIKLTEDQVKDIYQKLQENIYTNAELARQFCVSADTIHKINVGKLWHNNNLNYPIRVVDKTISHHFNGWCICQLNKETDELISKFPSLSAAAKTINKEKSDSIAGQLLRCCRNKSVCYGYRWVKTEISKEDWLKLFNQ